MASCKLRPAAEAELAQDRILFGSSFTYHCECGQKHRLEPERVAIQYLKKCPSCGGEGRVLDHGSHQDPDWKDCSHCNGTGAWITATVLPKLPPPEEGKCVGCGAPATALCKGCRLMATHLANC